MGTRKSTTGGQHSFAQIPSANIQRSSFDRSCGLKTTFDAGFLIPIFCDEVLPGDTMNMRATIFARLATPLHPVMDNMWLDTFWFFVPNRLLWDNWAKFNGEQTNPGDSTDFLIPQVTSVPGYGTGQLPDYFGLPVGVGNITHSALWGRAYNLIWADWFRAEDLQDSPALNTGDGPDGTGDYVLLKRGKRHDYFTSSLPFPQKGPAVELPLGTSAPVDITGGGQPGFKFSTGETDIRLRQDGGGGTSDVTKWSDPTLAADNAVADWDDPRLIGVADLSAATSSTINAIREAFQVQRMFERDARGGTRLTEIIRSHFGVISPDARLQRPEYLGGGSTRVGITTVAQTSADEGAGGADTPQGNLAGYGIASGGSGFTKSFVEHGVLLGLISARADLNYQQGIERMWSRLTRFDFYWPTLAHLGEQEVLNKEIFFQGITEDDDVFGYQERYAEYRYKPSLTTGLMRSNATSGTPLDTWHLAQQFSVLPILGDSFIQEDPPIDRIIAVPSEPHFIMDCYFKFRCARPMPVYGVPGQIDHF